MIKRQPKFQFGDKFMKSVYAEVEGVRVLTTIEHFVVTVKAGATSDGFTYSYLLAPYFPSAYSESTWVTDWIGEDRLLMIYSGPM